MDLEKIREDFPILHKKINGKPIIYFDNACMSLKPRQVVTAMNEYFEEYPACVGRSSHKLSNTATERYTEARKKVADFINAKHNEIVFTKNTTESLNLVANSLGLKKGDVVITTDKEHNSNLVPWQLLRERRGIVHKVVMSKEDGTVDMDMLEKMMNDNVKLVSMVHTSNIDGSTIPAKEIAKIAHDHGALVMLDGAQSVPHKKTDVKKIDADFLAFSGHKMLGPSIGVLYGKYHLLEGLEPFMVGGDTVEFTTYESHKLLKPPEKFEAGLQNYAGAIGLGAATEYLNRIGMENIERHEHELNKYIMALIGNIDGIEIIASNGGIISFNIKGMNFHDVALMLDETANIAVRSGQHCVHSWFNANKIMGSVRASFYLYNTTSEGEVFIDSLKKIVKLR